MAYDSVYALCISLAVSSASSAAERGAPSEDDCFSEAEWLSPTSSTDIWAAKASIRRIGRGGERRRVEGSGVVGSGDRQATNWRYYLQPRQTLQDYEGFAAVKSEVASGIRTPAGQLGSLSMWHLIIERRNTIYGCCWLQITWCHDLALYLTTVIFWLQLLFSK